MKDYAELESTLIREGLAQEPETPERAFLFKEMFGLLSREAQEVGTIVFNCPAELLEFGKTQITKYALTQYLKLKGWKISRITKAFAEIKSGLDELDGKPGHIYNQARRFRRRN